MPDQTRQRWKERVTVGAFLVSAVVVRCALNDLLRRELVVDTAVLALVWLVGATLALDRFRSAWIRNWGGFWVVWSVAMTAVRFTGVNPETPAGGFSWIGLIFAAYLIFGFPVQRWLRRADARCDAS